MKERGIEKIFVDKFTGINFEDRPEYQRLKRRLKKGDVLFIKSLDRLGRKYTLVLDEWRWMDKKGVSIVVMDMPILDTRNKNGNLMGKFVADLVLNILSFVSEQEYRNIHERQRQGIEAAKAAGVRFGKPRKPLPENFFEIAEDYRKGKLILKKAAEKTGMPLTTFYSAYQRYLNGEQQAEEEPLIICPYLKRAPNMLDCLYCDSPECSFENEKETFKFRMPPHRNLERERIKAKERRERRKALGLCCICGKKPPEEGRSACRECLDSSNERAKASYRKRKGDENNV
jgi:DNA invertase Pin-like site-specific DNA recombinase